MQRLQIVVLVLVLLIAGAPNAWAREATPVPRPGLAETISPVALFDLLLATPFPANLLPADSAPLQAYEWRDSNDADLAGAVGGVIFADGDPFSSELPSAITYVVYPDASGSQSFLAMVAEFGEAGDLLVNGQSVPAMIVNTGEFTGHFATLDTVLIYGMVSSETPRSGEAARALTEAGIVHLLQLAANDVSRATPGSEQTQAASDPFLAVAAALFPSAGLPVEVGSPVVLPMPVSSSISPPGLQGTLLVRDAGRTYPYPLAIYEFYDSESAALDAISSAVRTAGMSAVAPLPPEIEIPYPTTMLDRSNDSTTVFVQVGSTIVEVNAYDDTVEDRHRTGMALAQVAVEHLGNVIDESGCCPPTRRAPHRGMTREGPHRARSPGTRMP